MSSYGLERLVLVTDDIASNSLGRAYCLWLLGRAAGFDVTVIPTRGGAVWPPLRNSEFSESIRVLGPGQAATPWRHHDPDLLIAVKPHPTSLGVAHRWSVVADKPLLLDIDDPDIEAVLAYGSPLRMLAKSVLRRSVMREWRAMRKLARRLPTTVSNPYLQTRYGGALVPHVREMHEPGCLPTSNGPRIAFIGTNQPHKGLGVLRDAVARVQDLGYQLTVTDVQPPDAKPWETWVGTTSLSQGMRLASEADVIVLASRKTTYSLGQLPVKLVDAMMLGRPVIASDLPPIRWALGDPAQLIRPGSVSDLTSRLRLVADPSTRREMGQSNRQRALELFTVGKVAPIFASACEDAFRRKRSTATP